MAQGAEEMKRFNITVIEGHFVKDGETACSFTAADWRKRGGKITISVAPAPPTRESPFWHLHGEVEFNITEMGVELTTDRKGAFLEEALPRILQEVGHEYGCRIWADFIVDSVSQQQYVEEDEEPIRYEAVVQRHIISAAQKPFYDIHLYPLAQVAQRFWCLHRFGLSWPEGIEAIDQVTLKGLRLFQQTVDQLPPDERAELGIMYSFDIYYRQVVGLIQLCSRQGIKPGIAGSYGTEKVPDAICTFIRYITTKRGYDPWLYLNAAYDHYDTIRYTNPPQGE
jgi:hypothetical protein